MKTKTNDLNGNPIICAGSYRVEKPAAQIQWELAQSPRGPIFSATGSMRGSAGQCIDAIAAAHPNDAKIQQIAAVWRAYHLNGMKTGTPEQEAYLAAEMARNPGDLNAAPYNGDHYKWAVGKLKAARLYRVLLPLKPNRFTPQAFNYGEGWQYLPIPADVVAQVMSWGDNSAGLSFYDRQALDFLSANGIKFRANLAVPQKARDGLGNHYRVTLSGKARRLTFSFWGSIKDTEEGKQPTAYSVLSCVSSDANTPETFADFCAEYGYDSDSIKARDTFKRCALFARRIRAFFTSEELEGLAEIQ